jgi:hypothetical protein
LDGEYFFKSVIVMPDEISTSSSIKKLSVVWVDLEDRITWAASPMISGFLDDAIEESPPRRFLTAAV